MRFHRIVAGLVLTGTMVPVLCPALDKPTGAPLVMSDVETEQPIPLAYLSPDGKTAACTNIRLHWSPSATLTPSDDTASFALDIAADSRGIAFGRRAVAAGSSGYHLDDLPRPQRAVAVVERRGAAVHPDRRPAAR